ncbi:MAG: ABC transporter ATP-binding protein [Proteobacteria bacterium]|nr:ABC transporter ATP-binding protein [Pseudomonadota bacterium]MBI3498061.1 ABC transporter ATP-binding protein [Pseudomonadota bacterium]
MTQPLLEVDGLTVRLPPGADRLNAVEDASFTLSANEILCIVGESGSGKSLTAAAVMGLLPRPGVSATQGRIQFEGEDLLALSESRMRQIRGQRIAMIFQEPMSALNPVMRIGEQVAEVLEAHGNPSAAEAHARVLELLAAVGLPDPTLLAETYPFRLSGGQRQRVMIAIALALNPAILIADEPTTALDVTTQAQILDLIRSIQAERQMGVLFITHDFGVVADIAQRVAVMQHGRIVEQGDKRTVLDHPSHAYTRSLIAAVPRLKPPAPRMLDGAPVVLSAQGLRKIYRSGGGFFRPHRVVEAVKNVSLTIRKGETLGLVGESGSGKTTVGRCLVRLIEADGGAISFHGVDLRRLTRRALRPYRQRIQMVFQDPYASLNPRHKVGHIIMAGPRAFGATQAEASIRAAELLRLVGLDPASAERYPHEFSGGQRQRIGVARALALDPELLVADEPVSALDVSVQAQILDLLDDIRRRLDLAMLFITHDLRVAAQICDRVAVMHKGEIVEEGPTAGIFGDPRHAYTQTLIASIPGKDWTASAATNG